MRIGHGFDVHQLGGKGPIIIAGVHIPYLKSLISYSDGDVVLHAVIDSLLGAAAFGDIGQLFPDTDPTYQGANSRLLLRQAWHKITEKGYFLGNLDITIIVQAPKISPYISLMRANISKDLNCYIDNINIKATTTEKLGFIGRCEGIACEAIALLMKKHNQLEYY